MTFEELMEQMELLVFKVPDDELKVLVDTDGPVYRELKSIRITPDGTALILVVQP